MLMTKNKMGLVFFLSMFFIAAAFAATSGSIFDLPAKFVSEGKEVTLSKWKGTPLVVTMTYTSCQYACPRILERLKNVQKHFDKKGKKAQFLVATFDPVRDTTQKLKSHQESVGEIAKNWKFLTGSEPELRQLSMVLGIRFEKNPESGDITHDNKILIIDESGKLVQELSGLSPDVSELN